jgi:long-chain acyl-CoA synthetase
MVADLRTRDELLTGQTVEELARRGITGLEQLGCGEGHVVALMLRNDPAFLISMLMCRLGGFYACPINWHFKADEAAYVLRDSGARVLIIHADLLNEIASALLPGLELIVVDPSAEIRRAFGIGSNETTYPGTRSWTSWLAQSAPFAGPSRQVRSYLPYSSGTTGRPKGIKRDPLTPELVERVFEVARIAYGTEPGMRTAAVTPLYHSAPASYGVLAVVQGELISIHPRFDPERLLSEIEALRLTHLYLVPTLYVRLLRLPEDTKRRYDLSSLRFVASTGSPCSPDVKRAMIDWWGPIITETYASSEAGLVTICSSAEALARPGTAGRPLPWAAVKILDDEGHELPPGTVGRIFTRQEAYPNFTYLNNEAARKVIEHDKFIFVGDIGCLDEDGYLFVCDRKSDMVFSGGVNIYPAEIEAVLITMPEVVDCAVFGVPDPEYGEALAAHVQTKAGQVLSAECVRQFLRDRIAGFKVPKIIEFAQELPREETGKVFKRKLREGYWEQAGRQI